MILGLPMRGLRCEIINKVRLCNSLSLSAPTEQFLRAPVIGTPCKHIKKQSIIVNAQE